VTGTYYDEAVLYYLDPGWARSRGILRPRAVGRPFSEEYWAAVLKLADLKDQMFTPDYVKQLLNNVAEPRQSKDEGFPQLETNHENQDTCEWVYQELTELERHGVPMPYPEGEICRSSLPQAIMS
jgi:hypothetical protein